MNSLRPPRLSTWVLARLLDPHDRDAVLGDLADEYAQQRARQGSGPARRWYRRQAMRSLWPVVARRWLDSLAPPRPRLPADRKRAAAMDQLLQDFRHARRTLRRSPGFAVVALSALALGIGAATSAFSLIDALLLAPLPYPNADRLMMLWETDTRGEGTTSTPAPANFFDWQLQSTTFERMAAFVADNIVLTGVDEPERLDGYRVTAGFFDLLGIEAIAGRTLRAEEDEPGSGDVVVLSHALWQRRFHGDDALIGSTLRLGGVAYRVVGVMPPGFAFPAADIDYWRPAAMPPEEAGVRTSHYIRVIGRLAPDSSVEAARAEMDAIAGRLEELHPQANEETGVLLRPLREEIVGDSRPLLYTMGGAIALVLAIACANIAGLMLSRAAGRDGEIAVRTALGASRVEIARQFLIEAVVIAGLGAAGGMFLATYGVELLKAMVPADVPLLPQIGVDARALVFSAAAAAGSVLLFGVAPAWHAARRPPGAAFQVGGRGSSEGRGRQRLRGALVVLEIALAVALLVGAGLLLRSFGIVSALEPGFERENLLAARLDFSAQRYQELATRVAFYDQVLEGLEAAPGIESAAMITMLPMTFSGGQTLVTPEGWELPAGEQMIYPLLRIVSPSYLRTMRIPLRGRDFTPADREGGEPVAIVNRAFSRHYWPGEDPLGKRVKNGRPDSEAPWMTVIGVVDDVRQYAMEAEPRPEIYVTYLQSGDRGFFMPRDLVVRTGGDPYGQVASLRQIVRAVDADMPLSEVRSVADIIAGSVAQRRFNMLLIATFAAAALLLAALGVYGVVSHVVARRTREIGVRMALGAKGRDVLGMVLRQGVVMIGAGLLLGLAGALLGARMLEALLYGVSPFDAATFASVAALIAAVALLATLVPARRALRVDPVVALQSD